MASTHKHIRSSTANKRPTTAIADGQIALNTNASSPGLFFKDSTGASIIKIGPVHVGSSAPNATPGAGGSSGNSTGEIWLDNSLTPVGVKIWNGSAWVNATPVGSTTVQGLLELATSAETQTGTDTDRAVTPAGLQSKLSDSTSTTSSTTIASSTAVKSAYDLANAALPKSGGTITGNLEIGTTGSLSFEGSTADAFETTIAVTDPTADRTITLPDTTGTVVTTGDTGTVTSTMILDGTIVNGDINASAAIAHSKLANITAASVLLGNASNVPTATALTGDVTVTSSGVTSISSGVIVNADVNASAAIAGTKISPDFGSQNTTTTGTSTAASFIPTSSTVPTNGVYLPAANSVAISTNGANRFQIDSGGNITVDTNTFYVDAANNRVGVGTTIPAGLLDLAAADSATALAVAGWRAASYNGSILQWGGITASQWSTAAFFTAGTERARIDSSGRLGIGTSSPGYKLDVSVATNDPTTGSPAAGSFVQVAGGTTTVGNGPSIVLSNTSGAKETFWRMSAVTASGNNGDLVFNGYNGGANYPERLRITAAGNVGIGFTSVEAALHAGGNSASPVIFAGTDSGDVTYKFRQSRGTITSPGDTGGEGVRLSFEKRSPSAWASPIAEIYAAGAGSGGDGYLAFLTKPSGGSATERARIDSSGRLLVGTSSSLATYLTQINFAGASTNGLYINSSSTSGDGSTMLALVRASTPNNTVPVITYTDSTAGRFELRNNGGLANYQANDVNLSDRNAKKDISPAAGTWACIKEWEIVNYRYKDQPDNADLNLGVIAQQVAESCPEVITVFSEATEDQPEKLGVKEQQMYWMAIKALQEAQVRIETLEAEVAALKAQ